MSSHKELYQITQNGDDGGGVLLCEILLMFTKRKVVKLFAQFKKLIFIVSFEI